MSWIFVLAMLLAGCARHDDTTDAGLSSSTIPDKGCSLYSQAGAHLFHASGDLVPVDTFKCGIREGKACWYYVHYSDASGPDEHETRCVTK